VPALRGGGLRLRLLHLVDSVSGVDTTVKVEKVTYPNGQVDVHIHQIEGVYGSVEEFNVAWDRDHEKNALVNFFCVGLVDGRKLVNALIEEIKS
jgi:hypothetical protein